MKPYIFRLKRLTPETLPMGRLAEYLAALSSLVGDSAFVQFEKVTKGSAALNMKVPDSDVAALEGTIRSAPKGEPGSSLKKAYDRVQQLLAEDGTSGEFRAKKGGIILTFPGCKLTPKQGALTIQERGEINGRIIRLGGKDDTVPVGLLTPQGEVVSCTASREMAKKLKVYLLEPIEVVLNGSGKWARETSGRWTVSDFKIEDVSILDYSDISEALADLRKTGSGWDSVTNVEDLLHTIRYGS